MDAQERRLVNPFEWQRAFPQVFAAGGFDAVIGNPPYGAMIIESESDYIDNKLKTIGSIKDCLYMFYRKGF